MPSAYLSVLLESSKENIHKELCRKWDENIELREVLKECEEYFDQRADADHNGVSFMANEEMTLLTQIQEVLGKRKEEPTNG